MIVGVAGAFGAYYINFIDPSSFTTAESMDMLGIVAIFGGLGRFQARSWGVRADDPAGDDPCDGAVPNLVYGSSLSC